MLNINISNNVDIEYPAGDTFKFAVTEDNVIDASRRLRFQVSSNGNPKMIVIEKVFYPENNAFIISLSDDDTRKLEIHKTYEYRLTYFSVEDERTTTISGSLHVQWGAPNGNILHSPSVPTLHIGKLTIEKRMDSHRTSIELDHPDGSVTAKKIANGAISESKLNKGVIGLIASNKFDGYIATIADADGIDNRDNPHNVRIFRVGRDNGKGEGGILIVSGDTNTLHEHHPLEAVEQTYITHDGYVKTRHATNWDGYDGLVFEWSEWKSRYLTSEDVQELKAKTGYFSTSLAAGNVDYEIIAYDMTGIFGGLSVEPLSVLVSPDNTGIWESLSIVYADINGVRCKLNRSDFATNDLTANQINGYTGDKKDWFVYWYIGSDYDFNSEELNTGKYDISMAVPKFKVDEYGNIFANSLKLKYDDRAIQIVNTAEGESIALPDSADGQLRGLRIFGKTTQADTPSIDNPQPLESVGDDGSVDMNVHGYQLFDQLSLPSGGVNNAVQVVNNGDGSFDVSNPNENGSTYSYELKHDAFVRLFKTGKVAITGGGDDNSYAVLIIRYNNAVNKLEVNTYKGASRSIEIPDNIYNDPTAYAVFGIYSKPRTGSITIKPMVYQDGDGTWEQFKPTQTLTTPTPNGLPAVPVSSDGNYTDASGQQWVCDEIDYNRGVYVKRVYTYEITGEEPWKLHSELTEGIWRYETFIDKPINAGGINKVDICMCTHYKHKANMHDGSEGCWITTTTKDGRPVVGIRIATTLPQIDDLTQILKEQYASGNPVTIKYILAEPTETPLSEAEIEAYKALHTHYPHTSIHNSDNAHMAVDYVADTKNYVDNQIKKEVAELKALVLEV